MQPIISLVVAVAKNGVIGKDNQLIWHLSDDLKFFKKLTTGHAIIMGRKTYDSIGKPLPNRTNIVVSRNKNLHLEGCHVVHSLAEALETAKVLGEAEEVFIIGGENIYKQALPLVQKAYITLVDASPEGDAFFDVSYFQNWQEVSSVGFQQNEKNAFAFQIVTYLRP